MSFQSWHNYGIGLSFTEFEGNCKKAGMSITPEDIERLIEKAPELQRAVHEYIQELKEDNPDAPVTIEAYEEFDRDFSLGIAYIFAETIREAEGLSGVYATDSYDAEDFVIFGMGYPWFMNEREKGLTREQVVVMFLTYLRLLKPGFEDAFTVEIDEQSIENRD